MILPYRNSYLINKNSVIVSAGITPEFKPSVGGEVGDTRL
jgi:hypothetical protein